jgi:GT2 family glycosyltransferase
MTARPTISAVVINYNGGQDILDCLAALTSQEYPLEEIIMVDNGSTDGSPEAAGRAFPAVKVVQLGANLGAAASRNAGLALVESDLALVLDDDIFVRKDTIGILQHTLAASGASVVCPRIVLHEDPTICQCDGTDAHFIGMMCLRNAFLPAAGLRAEPETVGGALGACLLLDLGSIRKAGLFNELYFMYFEDHEFSLRVRVLGQKIMCQPAAEVLHRRGAGTVGLSFRGEGHYPRTRAFHTIRNRWLTILLVYQVRTLVLLLPSMTLFEAGTLLQAVLRGWLPEWRRAVRSLWEVRAQIKVQRGFIQRHRTVGDRAILQGGPLPFAQGFLTSRLARQASRLLGALLELNFRLVSPLLPEKGSR